MEWRALDHKLILHTLATLEHTQIIYTYIYTYTYTHAYICKCTSVESKRIEMKSIIPKSKCQSWMCIHVAQLILQYSMYPLRWLQLQLQLQRVLLLWPHKVYGPAHRKLITPRTHKRSVGLPNKALFSHASRARIFYCFPSILICFFYTS